MKPDSAPQAVRAEAGSIMRMVRRGALTRQQAVTLIQFTEAEQLDAVQRGVPAAMVKISAEYRDAVLTHFLKVIDSKRPARVPGLVQRKCSSSRRKAAPMTTAPNPEQPQIQSQRSNQYEGWTMEEIVAARGICDGCQQRRATHALGNRAFCPWCFVAECYSGAA